MFPTTLGYVPIQIAPHTPNVSVGVTNIRTKLENGAVSPRYHPAPEGNGGHTPGTGPNVVYTVVNAENTGTHSLTLNPSPTGVPKITGSFPGASGAQLIGKLIHEPSPNPHDNPSAISCALFSIFFTVSSLKPIRM